MNIDALVPTPSHREAFKRSRERFVSDKSGCYVLATASKIVLYIGLADNLRRRMNDHLESPSKTGQTKLGRAVLFYWFETPETNKVERTWMNIHREHEGTLPLLNKMYSPTAV
jgi:predicted GIY-YIG superfamily endonuclease